MGLLMVMKKGGYSVFGGFGMWLGGLLVLCGVVGVGVVGLVDIGCCCYGIKGGVCVCVEGVIGDGGCFLWG